MMNYVSPPTPIFPTFVQFNQLEIWIVTQFVIGLKQLEKLKRGVYHDHDVNAIHGSRGHLECGRECVGVFVYKGYVGYNNFNQDIRVCGVFENCGR
jgi:hypothetical protein